MTTKEKIVFAMSTVCHIAFLVGYVIVAREIDLSPHGLLFKIVFWCMVIAAFSSTISNYLKVIRDFFNLDGKPESDASYALRRYGEAIQRVRGR